MRSTGLPKTGLTQTGDVLLMPYAPVGAKRTRAELITQVINYLATTTATTNQPNLECDEI